MINVLFSIVVWHRKLNPCTRFSVTWLFYVAKKLTRNRCVALHDNRRTDYVVDHGANGDESVPMHNARFHNLNHARFAITVSSMRKRRGTTSYP